MHLIDWLVLIFTLTMVIVYGMYKSRNLGSSENYLAGKRDLPWITIGLSIMATQASAITFLSTPGQGFADGMQFAQFYFGMPIAMVILAYFILPIYYKLRITTAYEYLEQRFDVRMRTFAAMLFLLLRGISAAISIYAPGIILSTVFGWNLALTNFFLAAFVIAYTTFGGNAAVSRTQELQMTIMMGGLVLAFIMVLYQLPAGVGLTEAWQIAHVTGKTQVVDWSFSWHDRYNVWSGILGATFLFLSYFGTDQSQVGRYLSGKSLKESRFGLLFNGFVKIPMQLLVLSVGVMVYVFYQFNQPPLYFNQASREKITHTAQNTRFIQLEASADTLFQIKKTALNALVEGLHTSDDARVQDARAQLQEIDRQGVQLHEQAVQLARQALPQIDSKDKDYIFIGFIMHYLPVGLIGLMFAMIFSASWSTKASELNSLAATTINDIYRRSLVKDRDDTHYFRASRLATVFWGLFIMIFATYVKLPDNLIQAVNMIGSIFYGTMLGIFFTAFFLKPVGGKAVFWAALVSQAVVLYMFFWVDQDAYLWYNPLGCGLVMGLSLILEYTVFWGRRKR
ncbi:MAG: sodium:solute symporter [Bacteroidetes bacterium]|nr:sodium:solute symporter [Bacteroidota bacterium]